MTANWCLVSATVAKVTIVITCCTMKIVYKIWTTISHFDVRKPCTTTSESPVITHFPVNLTVWYCGVSANYPGGCMSATSVIRWTWRWHPCTSGPLETEPSRADSAITVIVVKRVRNLSVSSVQTPIILAFWDKKENCWIKKNFKKSLHS